MEIGPNFIVIRVRGGSLEDGRKKTYNGEKAEEMGGKEKVTPLKNCAANR